MTDPVSQARALVARPGETVDETDARCIAVRLADEAERLRAIVNAIIPAIGVFDPEDDDQVERIGLEWTTKYHAMARRLAVADRLAEAAKPLVDIVILQDLPGRDFVETLRGIGNNVTLKYWRNLRIALAAYREASK